MIKKYGPYKTKDGYVFYCYTDTVTGRNRSLYEHREVIAEAIGRYPTIHEVVHHKNGIRDDNRLENLEILQRSDHAALHHEPPEMVEIVCVFCRSKAMLFARFVRHNQGRQKKAGPFCGRSCAGKWSVAQRAVKRAGAAVHGSSSMYVYHKCRCVECRAGQARRAREYRARLSSINT